MTDVLSGRTVVITGATKGIGRAAALHLAGSGAAVVATGRDAVAGAELERASTGLSGSVRFVTHDVRREADWDRVMQAADALGPLDALVNNAGVFFVKPLEETTPQDFDLAWQVNVEGTFLGVRAAFAAFARHERGGTIVNVSSLMGQVGFPGATAYCASKGAITGLTKAAAVEGGAMRPRIRVNSLHPGVIWTPMITDQFGAAPELEAAFAAETPLRRVGRPEDIAEAIQFLVSDESSYMTGAELTVDGGRGAD